MNIYQQKVFGVAIAATKIRNLAQLLGRKNQTCETVLPFVVLVIRELMDVFDVENGRDGR